MYVSSRDNIFAIPTYTFAPSDTSTRRDLHLSTVAIHPAELVGDVSTSICLSAMCLILIISSIALCHGVARMIHFWIMMYRTYITRPRKEVRRAFGRKICALARSQIRMAFVHIKLAFLLRYGHTLVQERIVAIGLEDTMTIDM